MVQRITNHFLSCFRVAVPEAQYHRHRALPFTAHEALLFVSVHRRRNMSFVTIIVLRLCSPRCRSLSGWRWYFFSPTSREARRTAARDAFATRLTPLLRVSTHPPTHPPHFVSVPEALDGVARKLLVVPVQYNADRARSQAYGESGNQLQWFCPNCAPTDPSLYVGAQSVS